SGTGTVSSAATLSLQGTGAFDVTGRPGWSTPSRMNISGSSVVGSQPKVFSSGHYNHSAGTINPGSIGGAGTMNFQNGLNFFGGTGAFDLNGTNVTLGGGFNDLIDISGGLSLSPSHLRFNFTS